MESTVTFASYNFIKTNCSPVPRFPNSKPTRSGSVRSGILAATRACSGSTHSNPNPVLSTLKTTTTALIFAAAVFGKVSQLPAQACPPPVLTEELDEPKMAPRVEGQENSPFTQFLESNADAVKALSALLQQKLEAGEDEEGLNILRKLSSAHPEIVEWKFLMARLLNEMGNTQDARAVFEEILSINPLSFEALFENALLMDKCGEGEAVIRRLEEALKIAEEENKVKEARDVKLIKAQIQFLQKNVEEALGSYEELEKEDPKDFRPSFCKGMIYTLLDRNEEAREQFAKSRQLSPKPYEVEGYLRTPLSRMKLFGTDEGDNQQSEVCIESVSNFNSVFPIFLNVRGSTILLNIRAFEVGLYIGLCNLVVFVSEKRLKRVSPSKLVCLASSTYYCSSNSDTANTLVSKVVTSWNMKSGKAVDEKKHGVRSNRRKKEVNGDATTCPEATVDAMKSFGKEVHEKNVAKLSKDQGHLSHSNPATQTLSHFASGAEPSVRLGFQASRNGRGKRQRIGNSLRIPEMSSAIPLPAPVTGKRSSLLKDVHRRIGKFFFESGLELDAVNLPSFRNMMCASHRNLKTACTLPSYKDLEGWILEEEWKEMQQYAKKIRESWTQTGCSILLDGWQDAGGRSLVNILVASPKGTMYLRSADISGFDQDINSMVLFLDKVLREVGTENVVQVITYTTSPRMEEVGKSIRKKYTSLFWTVSVSHCIELMLKEITGAQMSPISMSSRQEGKRVAGEVADKASMPLVCALEFLSESSVPSIAYVYHIMDVAKEKIKTEFKGKKKSSYMPFWNAIDGIWNNYLHSPLHAAAAYLNPMVYYTRVYSGDKEVSGGLLYCIKAMPKPEDANLVFDQVNCYAMKHSAFGRGEDDIQPDLSPASWWHKYGWEVPELQRLAIRILSQTCDGAAKFNLKRSLAERFLTERGIREEQKRLLFVHYNLHLQNFTEDVDDRLVVEWMRGMKSWIDSTKK